MTTRHVDRLIASGQLPAFKVGNGRTVRIRQSALDALLTPVIGGDAA